MPTAPATLADLGRALEKAAPDMPVRFLAPTGPVGAGAHVTELKLVDVDSIDCGGRRSRWTEAQMQILDGRLGRTLSVTKIAGILAKSVAAMPGLADAPATVEYGKNNASLSLYRISEHGPRDGVFQIALGSENATCKPLRDMSCCGKSLSCCA